MQEARTKTWRVVQSSIGSEIARNDPQFLFLVSWVLVLVLVLVLTTQEFLYESITHDA